MGPRSVPTERAKALDQLAHSAELRTLDHADAPRRICGLNTSAGRVRSPADEASPRRVPDGPRVACRAGRADTARSTKFLELTSSVSVSAGPRIPAWSSPRRTEECAHYGSAVFHPGRRRRIHLPQRVRVYDTGTAPVSGASAGDHVTVKNGKITYGRFIVGSIPFDARGTRPADQDGGYCGETSVI